MIKTIWRYFLMSIRWLGIILIGCVLVVVGINAFDEDLAPETKALLAAPPNRYSPEQNIYLALMGLSAPPGESSMAYGQAKIAAYERNLEARLKDPRLAAADYETKDPRALAFKGKIDFCKPLKTSVWSGIESRRAEFERLLEDNPELYQRYLALHALPGYYETATPSILAPFNFAPSALRSLFLANFALRMKSGNTRQQGRALADMEGDLHVWRAVLAGDGSLISKMVAIANLQGDFLMLADMVADSAIDVSRLSPELARIMTPFDPAEWKIGKSFANEFRLMVPLWEQTDSAAAAPWAGGDEAPNWWERFLTRLSLHFFKRRATENSSAKAMLQLIKMADTDAKNLNAAIDTYTHWAQENLPPAVHYLYNPIGKVLVGVAAPNYEGYPLRAQDAAALQRLAKLGYEIRHQKIATRDIAQFIRQHPEWATHPVSGQAFSWDAGKNEIALKPLGNQPQDRRFSIPVWGGATTLEK